MANLGNLVSTPGGHEDARRKITDISPRVKHFVVYQEIPLGNHYHKKTHETFYLTKGKFEIKFEDPRTGERHTYEVRPGDSVDVPLLVAHRVLANPGTEFINVCLTDFDLADIYRYDINW